MLRKIDAQPDRLRLAHGTQGRTTQSVVLEQDGDGFAVEVYRINGGRVRVHLDEVEIAALAQWLTAGRETAEHPPIDRS